MDGTSSIVKLWVIFAGCVLVIVVLYPLVWRRSAPRSGSSPTSVR